MKKKIFVVGSGRSGTHWLGYILESSPEIKINIEKWPIFGWVTQAAVNYKKRKRLIPFIIIYYWIVSSSTKKHFADKSHPNIWLVDYLIKYIPNSYCIGIIRNPHATVSSMLLHKGVLSWIENWQKYPIPNKFLGITNENIKQYKNMPLEAKCTMRWVAHKRRLEEIGKKYPQNFLLVDYEKLFEKPDDQLYNIKSFLNLKNDIPKPKIKKESKLKWRDNLSKDQLKIINDTLIKNNYSNFIVK